VVLRLYDTARTAVVPFEPGPVVRMYVCGITPYDATHLGHANTYLTYDLLIRRLEARGHEVQLVRNITDVDDSILPKARSLGVDFLELAAAETARFHDDMAALDTRPPMAEPRATESIEAMLDILATLRDRGHTYTVDGTTYFAVDTFDRFGQLSHYTRDEMIELARERGGHPDDSRQRDPLDFVLWQPSAADEPSWDSPFGPGRPGWHLECSAMSMAALGPTIDLHGGGCDLIFPHHECEIAQSEAANGVPFVHHWMHAGLVAYQGTKMSKSLGNLVFVSELRKVADPRAIRLSLMAHHYREHWEWFDGDIDDGTIRLERLLAAGAADRPGPDPRPHAARLAAALDDDLDAPAAREVLDELARGILAGAGVHDGAVAALHELAGQCGLDLRRGLAPR
jgi:L-cysteine:1D-myo-inositol 2-amino-2-deoxy-alpha-D-glucopyranoside ligase